MVIAYLKKFWWVVALVAAAVVVVLIAVLTGGKVRLPLSPFQENIQNADTDAKIAKAQTKAKADADRAEIARIKKIKDGKERRSRIAEMLTRLDAESAQSISHS